MENWLQVMLPLMEQYKNKKHPLAYNSRYQLLVMVILSAQDSDKHINEVAPAFFAAYPSIAILATAAPEDLHTHLQSVRNFGNKCNWLVKLARLLEEDSNIPHTLQELTILPGIGRKSANVIMRESGDKAEGVIVDLHVIRVAPRIGIATGTQPEKIEKQIMNTIPAEYWGQVGMAISFLGREICRPSRPNCSACLLNNSCYHFNGITNQPTSPTLF